MGKSVVILVIKTVISELVFCLRMPVLEARPHAVAAQFRVY